MPTRGASVALSHIEKKMKTSHKICFFSLCEGAVPMLPLCTQRALAAPPFKCLPPAALYAMGGGARVVPYVTSSRRMR
jgi:hypothetical protein